VRPSCGTPAGQTAHKRHDETVCTPCAVAKADYVRALRVINGDYRSMHIPVDLVRLLLATASSGAFEAVRRELGPRTVAALLRLAQPHHNEVPS
jgi:hypothetical protein